MAKPIPFKHGRVDCIPDDSLKWTPYPFEATKAERHSNAYGSGAQAVDDFKRDFNMTARETISLMATHGLTEFTKNWEESTKYKWIGGLGKKENPVTHHDINTMRGTMSNMYYKFLNGKNNLPKMSAKEFGLEKQKLGQLSIGLVPAQQCPKCSLVSTG